MSSPKQFLANLLAPLIFTRATVSEVEPISRQFRRITLESEAFRKEACDPGDKVRIFLSDAGLRAYTPFDWDAAKGRAQLLVYAHDEAKASNSPGASWSRAVKAGDPVQLMGPQRSLKLKEDAAGTIVFGDETSIAVAKALRALGPSESVLEVSEPEQVQAVLDKLGVVGARLVKRSWDGAHWPDVQAALSAALRASPGARLVLTGRAISIQALKTRLKQAGAPPAQATRAYWADGKAGLE